MLDILRSGAFLCKNMTLQAARHAFRFTKRDLASSFIGGEHSALNSGLYGYNAILTIFAISDVFHNKKKRTPFCGLMAAATSVLITASLDSFLLPYSLPPLTMPFVLSTWLFLFAQKRMPNL